MIRFINCFEVPDGREEQFLGLWRQVNAQLTQRPGYAGHELHRALSPQARYRFVNYVEWQSLEHWQAAHDDAFRALVSGPEWREFPSTPAVYEVVDAAGTIGRPGCASAA